jgi:hypothetical protein
MAFKFFSFISFVSYIGLIGCTTTGKFPADASLLYLKKIQTPYITIAWYYKSLISNTTPDFVVLTSNQQDSVICRAHNISDVVLFGKDSIQIVFCGEPKLYSETIRLPLTVAGCKIVPLVLQDCKLLPNFRKTFY